MRIEAMRSWRFCVALVLLASALLYVDYQKFLFTDRTPWLSHRLILSLVCCIHALCVGGGLGEEGGAAEKDCPSARLSVHSTQTHTSTRAHTGVPGVVGEPLAHDDAAAAAAAALPLVDAPLPPLRPELPYVRLVVEEYGAPPLLLCCMRHMMICTRMCVCI